MSSSYAFGIEEEYFVFRRKTGDAQDSMSSLFFESAKQALGERVTRELLQSQIEVATTPCSTSADARDQLMECRNTLQDLAADHGLGILAAGTHPSAGWADQKPTEMPRYGKVAHDLQMIARRKMICGMHVHVEVPEDISRVDLMVRALPYIPLLLALSTSSPFWQSRRTGLMCYRQSIYAELPRSGLPDLFADEKDYDAYVAMLVTNRIIPDASYLWWVIRPSSHLPTLELRVADVCTYTEDAIAIAALYRSLIRHLCLNPGHNMGLTAARRAIVEENKWRAQRYGIHGSLIDLASGEAQPVSVALRTLLDLVWDDAEALNCGDEVAATQTILQRGTSADGQLSVYGDHLSRGKSKTQAIMAVVDWLAGATASVTHAGVFAQI